MISLRARVKGTLSRKKKQKFYSNINLISSSGKKIQDIKYRNTFSFPLFSNKKEEILIEFKEEEKELYLIGSFSFLDKFFVIKKNEKRYMISKLYSYKYIIKPQFKVNSKIKISYIYCIYNKQKDKENIFLNFTNKNFGKSTNDSSISSINNFIFEKKNFCNYYPKKFEMKDKPCEKPCHFPIEIFHRINSFKKENENKEVLILKDNNVFNSNNDSYKIINRKDHILLNHFY